MTVKELVGALRWAAYPSHRIDCHERDEPHHFPLDVEDGAMGRQLKWLSDAINAARRPGWDTPVF